MSVRLRRNCAEMSSSYICNTTSFAFKEACYSETTSTLKKRDVITQYTWGNQTVRNLKFKVCKVDGTIKCRRIAYVTKSCDNKHITTVFVSYDTFVSTHCPNSVLVQYNEFGRKTNSIGFGSVSCADTRKLREPWTTFLQNQHFKLPVEAWLRLTPAYIHLLTEMKTATLYISRA